jgi:hypothetical protein
MKKVFFNCISDGSLLLSGIYFRNINGSNPSGMGKFRDDFTNHMKLNVLTDMERIIMICENSNVSIEFEQTQTDAGYWPYVKININNSYPISDFSDVMYEIYRMVYR